MRVPDHYGWSAPKRVALGLSPEGSTQLESFGREVNATSYWDVYPREGNLSPEIIALRTRVLLQNAESIHFNLDGLIKGNGRSLESLLSLEHTIESGSEGPRMGNYTNWELYYIVTHPEIFGKTTFYLNGAPFKFPAGLATPPGR